MAVNTNCFICRLLSISMPKGRLCLINSAVCWGRGLMENELRGLCYKAEGPAASQKHQPGDIWAATLRQRGPQARAGCSVPLPASSLPAGSRASARVSLPTPFSASASPCPNWQLLTCLSRCCLVTRN